LHNSAVPLLLFDRINDLKIRLAETSYAAGLPASLAGPLGELAIKSLLADPASVQIDRWSDVIDGIARLESQDARW
jgi:hypothetical protein